MRLGETLWLGPMLPGHRGGRVGSPDLTSAVDDVPSLSIDER
jgi:hypothetical protein